MDHAADNGQPASPSADAPGDGDAALSALASARRSDGGAPRPRRRRELSPLRVALLVALLAGVVLAIVYGRSHQRRMALLRVQQSCLNYERRGDLFVYEDDPARAAELIAKRGEYVAAPIGGGPAVAGHVPGVWRDMLRWALPDADASIQQNPVLFLHGRQTAGGYRGLLCVQADRAGRRLAITFIRPGASTLDPAPVTDVHLGPPPQEGLVILAGGGDPFDAKLPPPAAGPDARADLRFYAGQPDPNDPTHLTIPYAHDGRLGDLDLWLQDDQTVHFVDTAFATGPASTAPSATAPR